MRTKEVSDMWWLKECPRCGGDLFLDTEYWELDGVSVIGCLQCGCELSPQQARLLLLQHVMDDCLAGGCAQGR